MPRSDGFVGGVYATAAFLFWGFVPLYWKAVGEVPASQMLAHRTIWAALLLGALMIAARRLRRLRADLRDPRRVGLLAVTATLLAVNWLVFIWAVQHGRVLEASLGYYINPLVNVVLGVIFLGERLRRLELAAVLLALLGVLNLVVTAGVFPWISLVLAVTFGFYGLLRKVTPVESLEGLTIETGLLTPLALFFLARETLAGRGVVLRGEPKLDLLVLLSGVITVLPLLWFANAARRLRYTTVGFFQYLAPTIHLLLAVLVFKESFTRAHAITFALIWVALVLYSAQGLRSRREDVATGDQVA